jgi:Fungal N-terminal domain of STAND proteins
MADPLSGAASAIGVITFGFVVCKQLYQIYESVKDTREDVRSLCEATQTLQKTLTALQGALERSQLVGDAARSAQDCVIGCSGALTALNKKLNKIGKLSSDPAVLTVNIYFRYAFRKKTIARLNLRIRQDLLAYLLVAVETLNL